ncbi:hypothetical protein Purlil1_11913 [Purpureocillium lilacinum]|uniref:Uncharacterized protein n=1 Tax=Purpureocillium lilacinum TaxID=33203 RepID=A0ABR0BIB8_PURLI|nr:hypothetical protein Purlil1_11913 [Purpureocillium lilacinum]
MDGCRLTVSCASRRRSEPRRHIATRRRDRQPTAIAGALAWSPISRTVSRRKFPGFQVALWLETRGAGRLTLNGLRKRWRPREKQTHICQRSGRGEGTTKSRVRGTSRYPGCLAAFPTQGGAEKLWVAPVLGILPCMAPNRDSSGTRSSSPAGPGKGSTLLSVPAGYRRRTPTQPSPRQTTRSIPCRDLAPVDSGSQWRGRVLASRQPWHQDRQATQRRDSDIVMATSFSPASPFIPSHHSNSKSILVAQPPTRPDSTSRNGRRLSESRRWWPSMRRSVTSPFASAFEPGAGGSASALLGRARAS